MKYPSFLIFMYMVFFSNVSIAMEVSDVEKGIYDSPKGMISLRGPNHIYLMEGPIDDWDDWETLEGYAKRLEIAFKTQSIFFSKMDRGYGNPSFITLLEDFRNVLREAKEREELRFDGDIRGDEAYISFEGIPKTCDSCDESTIKAQALQEGQYAFGWKQDSKGRSYIASPTVLKELERSPHIIIKKEEILLRNQFGGFGLSERDDAGILEKYKAVSKRFLHGKRQYVEASSHLLLIDFMNCYVRRSDFSLDLTALSSRSRIYILMGALNFKVQFKENSAYWRKERKVYKGNEYDAWVDLVPTHFKIGDHSFRLENISTGNQPGNGKLFGLVDLQKSDTYDEILQWLGSQKRNLERFKQACIERQKGKIIAFTYCAGSNKGQKAESINKFLNGLSLLFDFEVARRLVDRDRYGDLPILPEMPYLLGNFENLDVVKGYFERFFSEDARESFLREEVIKNNKGVQTQRKIRESLNMFHKAEESSGDEYED